MSPGAGLRPPPGPRTVIVVLRDADGEGVVPSWCASVRSLLSAGRADLVTCDVEGLEGPSGVIIDALARLQLTARRSGGSIRLRHPQPTLEELLAVAGFAELLPVCGGLVPKHERQVEEAEQRRIEEGMDADDPFA